MNPALLLLAATLAGCAATPAPSNPQDAFFAALAARCGQAYAGRIETDDASDAAMQGKAMVMHIRRCTPDRIEIPFHIDGLGPKGGWDRSRTWVVTRTDSSLRLKHEHRHADGTSDAVTMYGGDTASEGTATRLQWGASHLKMLTELAPADVARIEAVAMKLIDEAAAQPDAFDARSGRSMQRIGKLLREWDALGEQAALQRRLQQRLDAVCTRLPVGDARSVCDGVFKPAAAT